MTKQIEYQVLINKYLSGSCSDEEKYLITCLLKENQYFTELFEQETLNQWALINKEEQCSDIRKKEKRRKEAWLITGKPKTKSAEILHYASRIAATAVVLIGLSALLYQSGFIGKMKVREPISQKTVNVPVGNKQKLVLSDGSIATLNSDSRISQPLHFSSDLRKVTLRGQAFFNVIHNSSRPFIVETNELEVKVLGTSFDVKDYDDDNYTQVTVRTGKVAVSINGNSDFVVLQPDQQFLFNKHTQKWKVMETDAAKCISWTNGSLFFYHTSLPEVAKILKRWYGKEIILQNIKGDYSISGEHDNRSLNAVLEAIRFTTGINYKIENNKVILYQ
jgi:transmembrane sensor